MAARGWRWLYIGAGWAVLLLAVIIFYRFIAHRIEVGRQAEARLLQSEGLLVQREARAKELEGLLTSAVKVVKDLADQVTALKHRSPGVRLVEVDHYLTQPVAAEGHRPDLKPTDACVLALGDLGQVRLTAFHFKTEAGNRVIVGTGSAWRLDPGPPTKLFESPIEAKVSTSEASDAVAPPTVAAGVTSGWGAGIMVTASRGGGWSVGPAVVTPTFLHTEVVLSAGVGPNGEVSAGLTAVVK
jgi:hypothetical protein